MDTELHGLGVELDGLIAILLFILLKGLCNQEVGPLQIQLVLCLQWVTTLGLDCRVEVQIQVSCSTSTEHHQLRSQRGEEKTKPIGIYMCINLTKHTGSVTVPRACEVKLNSCRHPVGWICKWLFFGLWTTFSPSFKKT